MSKIKISGETSKSKEEITDQLISLIRSRLSNIKKQLGDIDTELKALQKEYQMDNDTFEKRFTSGELGDNQDYFIWEGLVNVKRDLMGEQDTLRELI